jgi:hypothetical protein
LGEPTVTISQIVFHSLVVSNNPALLHHVLPAILRLL